jgi:hypothetical protein
LKSPRQNETGLGIFFPLSEASDGVRDPFAALIDALSRLNQWETLHALSRLLWRLLTSWSTDTLELQRTLVGDLFTTEAYKRLIAFEQTHRGAFIIVFFRQQIVEAIRWTLFRAATNGKGWIATPEGKRDLLTVILASGDVWGRRLESLFKKAEVYSDSLEKMRQYSAASSRIGISSPEASRNPIYPLARSAHIFGDIMPRHLPGFHEGFRKAVGLPYGEFHLAQSLVWTSIIQGTRQNPLLRKVESDSGPFFHLVTSFLDQQSQSLDDCIRCFSPSAADPSTEWSLRPLRRYPILRSDDAYLVLDPKLFVESINYGPLFTAAKASERQLALDAFGRAFEEYVGEVLTAAYAGDSRLKKNIRILSGSQEVGQLDAYVDYGSSVIFVESKASFLNESSVISGDPRSFLREVDEKYVESGEGHKKGVSQLANAILRFSKRKWLGVNGELRKSRSIWPVLVVCDETLDDPFLLHYLAKRLQEKLGLAFDQVRSKSVHSGVTVHSLCIVSVDLLEYLEASLSEFSLLDLLSDFGSHHPDRMVSLHNYVSVSKYAKKMLPNERLNGYMKQKLNQIRKAYPGS